MKDLKREIYQKNISTTNTASKLIDKLMDENNTENVSLRNANGQVITFERIAIVSLNEPNIYYAILVPVSELPDIENNEGIVLKLDIYHENFIVVNDEKLCDSVLTEYERMINEDNDDSNDDSDDKN